LKLVNLPVLPLTTDTLPSRYDQSIDRSINQSFEQVRPRVFEDSRISTHADRTRGQRARHAVESPTGTFIVLPALADSSDFGLLAE